MIYLVKLSSVLSLRKNDINIFNNLMEQFLATEFINSTSIIIIQCIPLVRDTWYKRSPYISDKHGGTKSNLSNTCKKMLLVWDGIPLVNP